MLRKYEEQTILVLVNLSRSAQYVQINHPRFTGMYPEDMLGRTRFPAIQDAPYVVIVGPYGYHLMLLTQGEEKGAATTRELAVRGSWEQVFTGAALRQLEQGILPDYLKKCRWFQGKSRIITHVAIAEQIPFALDGSTAHLTVLEVTYSEGSTENYLLPLHFLQLEAGGDALVGGFPWAVLTSLQVDERPGVLYDALANGQFRQQLLALIARRKALRTDSGRLYGRPAPGFSALFGERSLPLASVIGKGEQSNSAVLYDDAFFLKIYRRMEEGTHPEVEIGKFLENRTDFEQVAPMAGLLEYHRAGREPVTLALLQGFVASQGDAWTFTLGEVTQFLDRVLAHRDEVKTPSLPEGASPPAGETAGLMPELLELMRGFYAEMVGVLGKRTAEFHLALASRGDDPAFTPEPFGLLYQRSVYQSMRSRARKTLDLLRRNVTRLAKEHRADALVLLDHEQEILAVLHRFTAEKFLAMKTRTHGDYHLGQVLYTGKDFVIIDFEGEPVKSLTERRLKQSPLRDVAGMMRSFFYAPYAVLMQRSQIRAEDIPYLIPWAETWYRYNAGIFLAAYLKQVEGAGLIPRDPAQVDLMLQTFMLDKALYELGYELNNRPDWVSIPIKGILGLLNPEGGRPRGEGAGTAATGGGSTEGTM